ncbi:MAG: hypothetical protein KAJ63_01810, partial [Methyloprofundus sp.]|nr:hypothetical protein [Methyloprofundus sp.]
MPLQENCFTPFKEPIDAYPLPERFTFPFYYQPHPLCLLAAKELQNHLQIQQEWQHNFGLTGNKETAIGKMFGVLLVQNQHNEIGYLSAFSGKIAGKNQLPDFVPPVFDMLAENGFFMQGQLEINQISARIKTLEKNPQILALETLLQGEMDSSLAACQQQRERMIKGRKNRKERRFTAETELGSNEFLRLKDQLSRQSIQQKNQLRDLNIYWNERIQKAEDNLKQLTAELTSLKKQRKDLSAHLQQKLFDQYRFLNINGTAKSLCDIFKETAQLTPPAAAGDCAAPKLLQYAF